MASAVETYLAKRLASLEEEVKQLRRLVDKPGRRQISELKGLWQGIEVTEEDIEHTQRSLAGGKPEG